MGNDNKNTVPADDLLPEHKNVVPADDLPTPQKKTSGGSVITPSQSDAINSSKPVEQQQQPLKTPTDYQWSNGDQGQTPLATGGAQGAGTNINPYLPQDVAQKVGNKKPTVYIAEKANELARAQGDIEEHKTNLQNFDVSPNFRKYMALQQQLQQVAPNAPGYNDIVQKIKDLEKEPFDVTPINFKEADMDMDELKKQKLPPDMQGLKTVGDAVHFYNTTIGKANDLTNQINGHVKDIQDVVTPMQEQAGIKLDKQGYHEMGVWKSLNSGLYHNIEAIANNTALIGASQEKQNDIYKSAIGAQMIDPEKPQGDVAEMAQTAGSLLPFFIPGVAMSGAGALTATIGDAVANGLMMSSTNGWQAGLEAYRNTWDQTHDENAAAASANSARTTGGIVGGITGATLGLAGKAGEHVALSALDKDAVERALTSGTLKTSALSLPEYLAYNLPKQAIQALPFALGKAVENKFAQARGEHVDVMDNVASQYFGAMFLGHIMDGVIYGGGKLAPKVKEVYQNAIARYGNEPFQEQIRNAVTSGDMTPEQAAAIAQPIQDKATAHAVMPEDLTPAQQQKAEPIILQIQKNSVTIDNKDALDVDKEAAASENEKLTRQLHEIYGTPLSLDEEETMADFEKRQKEKGDDGKLKKPLTQPEKELLKHLDVRQEAAEAAAKLKKAANDKQPEGVDTGAPAQQKTSAPATDVAQGAGVDTAATGTISVGAHSPDPEDAKDLVSGKTGKHITPAGEKDAAAQAEKLQGKTQIVTSPEQRAADTAKIIADKTGAKVDTNENLNTLDIGEFHGMKADEFKPIHEWFVQHPDAVKYSPQTPEGGLKTDAPGFGKSMGESINDFAAKVKAGMEEVKAKYPGENVHVVTHGYTRGVMDAIEKNGGAWNDTARKAYMENPRPEATQISKINAEKDYTDSSEQPTVGNKKGTTIAFAPFRSSPADTLADDAALRNTHAYRAHQELLKNVAAKLGIKILGNTEVIGGWKDTETGKHVQEISNVVHLDATPEQAKLLAAAMSEGAPEEQNSVMVAQYHPDGRSIEHRFTTGSFENGQKAVELLKKNNIENFSVDKTNGDVILIDHHLADKDKINNFKQDLKKAGYGQGHEVNTIEADFPGSGELHQVLYGPGSSEGQPHGRDINDLVEAERRRYQPEPGDGGRKVAGRSRYWAALPEAAKQWAEKAVDGFVDKFRKTFGLPEKTTTDVKLDKDFHQKIAAAFAKLPVDDSANPEVKDAYEQLGKEVDAQYNYLTKKLGIKVDFVRDDPYPNSKEMMRDVYEHKHLSVFQGGGDHPFLGEKSADENGLTLNEKLRAVHDFFGHAVEGNEFGPVGEEKAWVAHSKMFSDDAQRALSTETRGQNATVNNDPRNDEITKKYFNVGNELVKQGKVGEGQRLINEGKQKYHYADQKVALLPKELTDWRVHEATQAAGETTSPSGDSSLVKEESQSQNPPRTTSGKNAATDKELDELGLNQTEKDKIKANPDTWEKVKADVDSGKVNPLEIADRVNDEDNPVLSDEETMALTYQKAKILNEHDKTAARLEYAIRDKDEDAELKWLQHQAKLNNDFQQVADALKKGGTGVGRALQARQAETRLDNYSLLNVMHELRSAAGPEGLTEKQTARVEELVKKNKAAEAALAEHQAKIAELEKGLKIQQEINAQQREAQVKAKGKYTVAGKEIADKIRKLKGKPLILRDENGNEINVKLNDISADLIELAAKAAEAAGKGLDAAARVAVAVKTVIDNVKDADWYKKLTDKGRAAVEKQLTEHFGGALEKEKVSAGDRLRDKIAEKANTTTSPSGDSSLKEGGELAGLKAELKARQKELVQEAIDSGKKVTHEDVTRQITGELEQHYKEAGRPVDFDERQVRDVLSGYGEARRPSQEELAKELRDLNAKARLASSKEDVLEKGTAPLKSGYQPDKQSDEIRGIQREIKAIMKEKGITDNRSPEERWKTALEEWRRRTGREIEKRKQQIEDIKNGKAPAQPKEPVRPMSNEDLKLQADAKRYKNELDDMKAQLERANRSKLDKALDWIPKVKRFSILLSYHVLAKLAAAGVEQAGIFTPARKLVQTGLGKIPGLSSMARRAPTEGHLSAEALAANYRQFMSGEAWKDAYNTLKTGKGEIDQVAGKEDHDEKSWMDFVQNSHAAIKTIPKRAEYFSAVQSAAEWAIKNGMDLHDLQTQRMIHDLAYDNALRNVFMNKNQATTAWKSAIGQLKNSGGEGGKIAASLMQTAIPITGVPVNIVNDMSSYTPLGFAKAIWTMGVHGKGNADNLSPQQADHIMRSVGKGTLGSIGMAAAYVLYKSMGGLYHQPQGKKKPLDDLKPGDIQTPVGTVPAMLLHHPGFVAAQVSADLERQMAAHLHDKHKKGKEPFDLRDALIKSTAAILKDVPFLEQPASTFDVLKDKASVGRAAAQAVSGFIPQVVKEVAKDTDPAKKRKAKTGEDIVKSGIPGLREQLPVK